MIIAACPKCGKQPKIKISHINGYWTCTISHWPHMKPIKTINCDRHDTVKEALMLWNEICGA